MTVSVLCLLASTALLTLLRQQEHGSSHYQIILIATLAVHHLWGFYCGQRAGRRKKEQQKEVRPIQEKEVRLFQESVQRMGELSKLCEEINEKWSKSPHTNSHYSDKESIWYSKGN